MTHQPLFVCECIARERVLPTRGPRSMIGDMLPSRNDPWLNAGPRAFIAFMCGNADIKFPLRLPIQDETLEVFLYDINRHQHCGQRNVREQSFDMQAAMATHAGYFGGYAATMQHVGERETRRMNESTQRSMASSKTVPAGEDFKKYSRRLVRDLEIKGIARTAVERYESIASCSPH